MCEHLSAEIRRRLVSQLRGNAAILRSHAQSANPPVDVGKRSHLLVKADAYDEDADILERSL